MLNLLLKDLKNMLYDKKSMAIIIIMPIVLMTILGLALQNAFNSETNSGINHMNVGVVKQYDVESDINRFQNIFQEFIDLEIDSSEIDLEEINPETLFFQEFLGSETMEEMISYDVIAYEQGMKKLEEGDYDALILLPKNFVYDSYVSMVTPFRNRIQVEIIQGNDSSFVANILEGAVSFYFDYMNHIVAKQKVILQRVLTDSSYTQEQIETLFSYMEQGLEEQITIQEKTIHSEDLVSSFQYYAAAIMAMFLLYNANIGGKALLEEKEKYTFQRLQVVGYSFIKLSISNFFRIMFIGIIQSVIMIVYAKLALQVNWGDPITVISTLILYSFSIAGLGTLISTLTVLFNNYKVAIVFEAIVINGMALLGGSFIPIQVLPEVFQKLNFIAFNGAALKMYLNAMTYNSFASNIRHILSLCVIGFVFISISIFLIKRQERRNVV